MSAPKPDRLFGVRAKIERAKQHIHDLEFCINAFRDTQPYGVRTEQDLKTGKKIKKLHIRKPLPDVLPLMIGDAIHNLRSAFDHLAWQLVEATGAKPTKDTGFPIYETAAKYAAMPEAKVKGMDSAAIRLIDAVQPYQRGYADLWTLHRLDIVDKHQLLLLAAYAPGRISLVQPTTDPNVSFSYSMEARVTTLTGAQPDGRFPLLQDGTEIGWVIADVHNPTGADLGDYPDVDFQFAFEVAFREPKIVEGKSVLVFLTNLLQLVERIVEQFVPFL